MTKISVTEERTTAIVTPGASTQVSVKFPGPAGPAGATGPEGAQGIPGAGVPAGGEPGQIIEKVGEGDYETAWTTPLPPSLQDISDIDVSDKQDNSILYYNLSSDKWKGDDLNTLVSLTDGGNF